MTCVRPKIRTRRVILYKDIKINGNYYWSKELINLGEQKLPVKYDPQDTSIAYPYIGNEWLRLLCK
nr:Mu transposase C-terminal domain-containing protein [Aquibacillus halophilus]